MPMNKKRTEKKYMNQRKKHSSSKNKTMKVGGKKHIAIRKPSHITKNLLELLNMVKLYHWKTYSYAEHEATDTLYAKLSKHIDEFVEVLLGKDDSAIQKMEKKIKLIDAKNTSDLKKRVYEYRDYFISMNKIFDEKDSDLLNIRDEIIADLNRFLYLSRFK
jgi:DNA-binding ferritin-like protein